MDIVEHVDRLAVGVSADDDVLDLVEDTRQLEHRGLGGHAVDRHQGADIQSLFDMLDITIYNHPPVRNHVAGISDDEHISHVGLSKPRGQHPGVDAGDEDGGRVGVVSDPLEVLQHVALPVRPVAHDAMQNVLNALGYFNRHFVSEKHLYHYVLFM